MQSAGAFARSITRASARQGVGTQQGANQGVLVLAAPRKIAPAIRKMRRCAPPALPSIGQSDGAPHVLEGGLFLIISAELRAIQLARRRAPCMEIVLLLLEGLPTVGATAGRALDREAADDTHQTPPPGA